MARIRMAQYGTGHGHAGGKMNSMLKHPDVDVAGIFEPNAEKAAAARSGSAFADVTWFESEHQMLEPITSTLAQEFRGLLIGQVAMG